MKKKTTSSAVKKTPASAPVKKPAAKKVAAQKPAVKKASAPVIKKTAPAPLVTVITASIDIGFGHLLYIRGEGPGLSWDKGVPMACIADNEWRITLGESAQPIVFKFLVDDLSWSAGADYVVVPGSAVLLEPTF